jgi:signal transduction histidine kinase
MPALAFDVPEDRAGSAWLAREGRSVQGELLGALLGRFNHDLRTPLNTVMSWTHLLQQGKVDVSRHEHVMSVLARSTREQVVALDEFVDDSRAVLGALEPCHVELRIENLVARAAERAAPAATRRGVSFDVRPLHALAVIEGDEQRLQRLVYRLLAVVASRAREGAVVEVSSRFEAGSVALRIEAPATADDWTGAALLELRISSFVAGLHDAALAIDGAPGNAAVALRWRTRA